MLFFTHSIAYFTGALLKPQNIVAKRSLHDVIVSLWTIDRVYLYVQ